MREKIASALKVPEYTIMKLELSNGERIDPQCVIPMQLAEVIRQIVQIEGPMHEDVTAQRVFPARVCPGLEVESRHWWRITVKISAGHQPTAR